MNFLNFSATFKKPIKPLSESKEYSSGHLFSIHKKYVAHRCATDLYLGQTVSFQNLLLAGLLSFPDSLVSQFSKICITLLMLGPPRKFASFICLNRNNISPAIEPSLKAFSKHAIISSYEGECNNVFRRLLIHILILVFS